MFDIIPHIVRKSFKRNIDSIEVIEEKDLNNYLDQGAILIDVRSSQEFREGHINRAISIPDYKIKKDIESKILNKNQIIILYCVSGHRSKKVKSILEKMGYKFVYILKIDSYI